MLKKTMIALISFLFIGCVSLIMANSVNAITYPDIVFNSSTAMTYDATTHILSMHAVDSKIVYPDLSEDFMTGTFGGLTNEITMDLNILIDNTGKLMGDAPLYLGNYDDVVEKITKEDLAEFSFKALDGTVVGDWGVDDIILQGDVESFSYANFGGGLSPTFILNIDPFDGSQSKFIDKNIFPDYSYQIYITSSDQIEVGESWATNWALDPISGDKYPNPEPGTMLLLGLGLLGLMGISRRKRG